MDNPRKFKILWIDDDNRILRGFLRKVEEEGVIVDYAGYALEGYMKIKKNGAEYDLILVDIILPLFPMSDGAMELPDEIRRWEYEDDLGIFLVKEIIKLYPMAKVAILSILDEGAVQKRLGEAKVLQIFPKQTISSAELKEKVMKLLAL
jgi:CheY-like chemotaxis protein